MAKIRLNLAEFISQKQPHAEVQLDFKEYVPGFRPYSVLHIDAITAPKQIRRVAQGQYGGSDAGSDGENDHNVEEGAIEGAKEEEVENAEEEEEEETGPRSLEPRRALNAQLTSLGLLPGQSSAEDHPSSGVVEPPERAETLNGASFLIDCSQLMGLSPSLKDVSITWEAISAVSGYVLRQQKVTIKAKEEKRGIWLSKDPVELKLDSECDFDSCLRVTIQARRVMPIGRDGTGATEEVSPRVVVTQALITDLERLINTDPYTESYM